jgi:hypothetical protein
MKRFLFAFAAVLLTLPVFAADRITYDSQCLTIDGKDTFIFSGAFHYFRCPKELWHDRLAKMKLAGCNAVETYVAWNWHEREKPASVDDYSKADLTDLDDFLKMAEDEFGLYVILRPGPYICAEWDNGGYPRWLLPLKPADYTQHMWLRSDEPTYLAWCKHWYTAVAKVAVPHMLTHRPAAKTGIILWQIENEYDYANEPENVKRGQLSALAHDARDLGVDVPLFTCQTRGFKFSDDPFIHDNVIETDNSYPKYDMEGHRRGIESVRKYQPDKFLQVTEQQGGWFGNVGGKLSSEQGYDDHQINMITMVSLAEGVTSMNYYMFFGGTNLGDWAGHGITTSYDYDAPIREWGGVDKRYAAVRAIGLMLQEHGSKLARAVLDKSTVLENSDKEVRFIVRRPTDGSKYIFVSTEQRKEPKQGTAKIQFENGDETVVEYSLDPYGAKILYMPTDSPPVWLPKPAPEVERPADLPAAVTISEALRKDDPGPTSWKAIQPGQMLEDLGINDSRFVFYHAKFTSGDKALPDAGLNISPKIDSQDAFVADVGGKLVFQSNEALLHVTTSQLDPGVETTLLYENTGHDNGGPGMERNRGLASWITTVSNAPRLVLDRWRMKRIAKMTDKSVIADDVDDTGWDLVDVQQSDGTLPPEQIAAYRATVDVTEDQLKDKQTLLRIGRIDDHGIVYVNGQRIANTDDWSAVYTLDIASNLHAGKNSIAIIVKNDAGSGGLCQGVSLEPIAEQSLVKTSLDFADSSAGTSGKWWSVGLDDSGWEKLSLGNDSSAEAKSMLTWYRVKFELPDAKPGVWVPWNIDLEANGNGFIYLNDHPLGRYWQVGPQHEYFLPECWLKTGKGQTNVVTLCLRPTPQGNALNKAVVQPYADWAEKR